MVLNLTATSQTASDGQLSYYESLEASLYKLLATSH